MKKISIFMLYTVVVFVLSEGRILAGTISMNIASQYFKEATNLVVTLENKGDEAAQNVTASVEFMGRLGHRPPIPTLEPFIPQQTLFPITVGNLVGTFPVIITVGFEDLNGYPFTSIAINQLRSENAPLSPLRVVLSKATIRGQGHVKAKIFNPSDKPIIANYRFLVSREVITNNGKDTIELAPKSSETFNLHLENFSAIPGANYPVHLLLEHVDGGIHYLAAGVAMTKVYGKSFIRTPVFWIGLGVIVLAIILSLGRGMKKPEETEQKEVDKKN